MTHEDPSPPEGAGRPLARDSSLDLVVAACLALAGAVVVVEARRLGASWQSDGPGAGYFPFYIGLILLVCGVATFVQALNARKTDTSVFVDSVQLRQVLSVLGPSVLYVAVTVGVGIYIASALFIAVFMIVLGRYAVMKSVIVGASIGALFFLMFEVWFKVPLYKGLWNPLAFLGY